jgi:hypothetical protein
MGLDVYLYHHPKAREAIEIERKYNEEDEAIYEEDLTDEQRKEKREALKKKYNMGDWHLQGTTEIKEPSQIHPDHGLFNIGYMRSSYNSGGINTILRTRIGMDLYTIFEPGDDYHIFPDWGVCLNRAREVLQNFRDWVDKNGSVQVISHSVHNEKQMAKILDDSDAMDLYLKHKEERNGANPLMRDYMNGEGSFFFSQHGGGTLRALIPGYNILGSPCIYAITETDPVDQDQMAFYIQALEIVCEMCEWVLGKDDPHNYYLRWSG